MVKTTSLSTPMLLAALTIMLGGCAARGPFARVTPESLVLSRGPAASFLSLAERSGTLYAVYADRATTTLDSVEIPAGPHLPATAPAPEVIDKVDVVPPLSPSFGDHVVSVAGGAEAVLYVDRETDVKSVLKLATRPLGQREWELEILEPAGDPLALAPGEESGFDAAWSSGLLSYKPARRAGTSGSPALPFQVQGRASADGAGGFTAFDALTSSLLFLRWTGTGFSTQVIEGGTPVHASLRTAGGRLKVVTWDARSRRIILHQEGAPGGSFTSATVTLSDGTRQLALLPGDSESTVMVVFDETHSVGAGRTEYQVSVIAPGSLLGSWGGRYRKAVLTSGEAPIDGLAAVRSADALYVLASQGDLALFRIPITR
jgi:hypothetical protein